MLPCNASAKLYPKNTIADYTTKLAKAIHLRGPYEAALVEIQYPHTWQTFGTGDGVFSVAQRDDPVREFFVKLGYCPSMNELIKAINNKLDSIKIPPDQRLRYDEIDRTVYVTKSSLYKFMLGEKLGNILGLQGYSRDRSNKNVNAGHIVLCYNESGLPVLEHFVAGDLVLAKKTDYLPIKRKIHPDPTPFY